MKILVINTGSSSIKYQLFEMTASERLAWGLVEKIGEESSRVTHQTATDSQEPVLLVLDERIPDHHLGMNLIVKLLVDPEKGVIKDISEISAVGHRVVHGGETFNSTTIIDEHVLEAIKENIPLAPLHNPPNLIGIETAGAIFPHAVQVAVFDTAFHQTIPPEAYLYALPYDVYQRHKVRRYGFHGTSHAYVAEKAAEYLGRPLTRLDLITIHLGNGASMAAVKNGRCLDTSMGMTPLAGLVMGTRTGDLDPALPLFLSEHLGMTLKEIDATLNKESGLKGICGDNDMRTILSRIKGGDARARMALDIYTYRIRKYIGAYLAVLGRLDAVIFTAGIGENSPDVRELVCRNLEFLGLILDQEKNRSAGEGLREINTLDSPVKILVAPTNEELKIAQETRNILDKK